VRFNILYAIKHPAEDHSIFHIDLLADLVDDNLAEFVDDVDFSCLVDYSDFYTWVHALIPICVVLVLRLRHICIVIMM